METKSCFIIALFSLQLLPETITPLPSKNEHLINSLFKQTTRSRLDESRRIPTTDYHSSNTVEKLTPRWHDLLRVWNFWSNCTKTFTPAPIFVRFCRAVFRLQPGEFGSPENFTAFLEFLSFSRWCNTVNGTISVCCIPCNRSSVVWLCH